MKERCEVKNGVVEPCSFLNKIIDYTGLSKAKGVYEWQYFNVETGELSSSYIGVKSKEYPNGMVFEYCPFCGTRIREEG